MAARVYVLHRLREGVTPADYERWVREVDYPFSSRFPAIRSYEVVRLEERLMSDETGTPWDYLELIEPVEFDAYFSALTGPGAADFVEEWSSFVADYVVLRAETIDADLAS